MREEREKEGGILLIKRMRHQYMEQYGQPTKH